MVMDKMDGTGEQGQRGVHALACAVAFSSPFWFLERPLICEFVRLYANILAYFEKKYFFPALWSRCADTQRVGDVSEMECWSIGELGKGSRRKTVEGYWLRIEGWKKNERLFSAPLRLRLKINGLLPAQTCGGIYNRRQPYSTVTPRHTDGEKCRRRNRPAGLFTRPAPHGGVGPGYSGHTGKKTDRKRK